MIEAVEIAARDGTVLRGEVIRAGPDWVVLVHDRGRDLDAWVGLRHALASEGMSVLAYDLRGHGGSDGRPDTGCEEQDVEDVLAFVRRAGAERLFVAAVGSSVSAALTAAAGRAAGIVALDPPGDCPPALPALRTLVIVPHGASAPALAGFSLAVYLPDGARGHELLRGGWASCIEGYVLRFLRGARLQPVPR
jgi:pimeloyl-ACP methyl ester carboxylesterase